MLEELLKELKNKRILILGFGREGRDSFRFLRKLFPKKVLGIGDRKKEIRNSTTAKFEIRNDKKIKWHFGEDYLKAIKKYDVIIKSPGIPIHLPEIEKAYKQGKITSQTEIFFENCPGKIIGITGTKGKGTTTFLIYQILKAGLGKNQRIHLVGNIGKPVLQLLFSATPKDIYVYELSSHQLYNLKKSPQIAVFLNIYPDHLDYYKNFKEYLQAKQNITRYQTPEDYFIFNSQDKNVRETAKISKAKKIPIKGIYYELNKNAARAVGEIFNISKTAIEKAINQFKPLPHRLEYVGTYNGIKFYNDSASTMPQAAIYAIETLGGKMETLILGGSDKNLDFKNLAKKILKSKIKNLILFPTTGEKIWQALRLASLAQGKKLPKHFFTDNMKEAIKLAYRYTGKGKICLLSPASASFNLFRDYRERGNLFKKFVKRLGKLD